MVSGSESLCKALGKESPLAELTASVKLPGRNGAANPQQEQMRLQRWYFGSNSCVLEYPSESHALVTRATHGLLEEAQNDPAKIERVTERIAALRTALDQAAPGAPGNSVLDRVLIHSLAWELVAGLGQSGTSDAIKPLVCEASALLDASRPSPEQLATLEDPLPHLATAAEVPEIAPLIDRLLAKDPAILEVLPVSDSHTEALLGRFSPRIFLTGLDAEESEAIGKYLRETPYELLGRLPLRFKNLEAVLLLYVNVLDDTGEIVPTNLLAFWQEYTFTGQISLATPDLPQAEEHVEFRTVRLLREPGAIEPSYVVSPQNGMAHKSFVEAMPPRPGSPVTVLRGVCLKCHTKVVETFHPQAKRELEFTAPFERSTQQTLAPFVSERIAPALVQITSACKP